MAAPTDAQVFYLDATELARRIRTGELSPVALLQTLRERASRLDPALNALVTPIEAAESEASAAEAAVARGDELGPLHGVPVTVKDAFDVGGVRTTRGSRIFADRIAPADATVVARLRAAGAIPIAKTNIPEFALWWETDNLVFGRTSNPWDVERTAGGSSGGEAAGIAAGLSPLGVGSDLGGSIRLPAHHCGVVGLKPTHGRVPLTGHFPEVLLRFMHAGFLARSVRDVALALSVTAGPDGSDWLAQPVPAPAVSAGPAGRLRVGILRAEAFGGADPDVLTTLDAASRALESLGWPVEEVAIPALDHEDWNVLTMLLYGTGGTLYWQEIVGERRDELHPRLRSRLGAPPAEVVEYLAADAKVDELRRSVEAAFGACDVLLCPTVPTVAHPHDADETLIAGTARPPRMVMRATIPFDITGSPAISLPFGTGTGGLPIGVQLVGRRFDEETLLAAALALEELRGPLRHPPV